MSQPLTLCRMSIWPWRNSEWVGPVQPTRALVLPILLSSLTTGMSSYSSTLTDKHTTVLFCTHVNIRERKHPWSVTNHFHVFQQSRLLCLVVRTTKRGTQSQVHWLVTRAVQHSVPRYALLPTLSAVSLNNVDSIVIYCHAFHSSSAILCFDVTVWEGIWGPSTGSTMMNALLQSEFNYFLGSD